MPREYKRQLSKDDIGNQARVLLNHFIHDRISREQGEEQVPSTEELQEPGTPTGQRKPLLLYPQLQSQVPQQVREERPCYNTPSYK